MFMLWTKKEHWRSEGNAGVRAATGGTC